MSRKLCEAAKAGEQQTKRETDVCGRATNCFAYTKNIYNSKCSALVEFYNLGDYDDLCGGCPFFKTEEEFIADRRAAELRRR